MRTILLPVAFLAVLPVFAGRTVTASPYADKVTSAAVGEVTLGCKEPGGWTFARGLKRGADGVETLTVTLTSDAEAAYPIVESGDGEERIVAVYNDESLCDLSAATERRIILVNATGRKGLTVRLPSDAQAEVHDTLGQLVERVHLETGLSEIGIPDSGSAELIR